MNEDEARLVVASATSVTSAASLYFSSLACPSLLTLLRYAE